MEELADAENDRYLAAYFFLPLPRPIAIPNHFVAKFLKAPSFEQENRSQIPLSIDGVGDGALRVSLLFWQIETSSGMHAVDAAHEAALKAFPDTEAAESVAGAASSTSANPRLPLSTTVTVVEAMCVLDEDHDDPYTEAFDAAVDGLNRLLRSYYAVSQHPVPLVSVDSLPPIVPLAIAEVSTHALPKLISRNIFTMNPMNFGSKNFQPNPLDEEQLDTLLEASTLDGGPFEAFADLRREAQLAFNDGNAVTTAVLYGCVLEALIRELFLLMLWESEIHPSAAVGLVDDRSITDIAKKEFHKRLGGNWNVKQPGPVRGWFEDVRRLRNLVVHSGYLPTYIEARRCHNASIEFEHFISGRLMERAAKFPITSWIYLGYDKTDSLKARNVWDRFFQQNLIVGDLYDAFRKWKTEVDRYRDGPSPGNARRSDVVLVKYKNGHIAWWLVDRESRVATQCEAPKLSHALLQSLQDGLTNDDAEGAEVSCQILDTGRPAALDPGQWHPMSDVIPLNNIRPYLTSLVPPPGSTFSVLPDVPQTTGS